MNLSCVHACIYVCNRIHLVYVHSSSYQLSIVTHWQSKYLGLALFLQYSLRYYSFILFLSLFAFASCHTRKGAYYIDEFLLWLHLAATHSLFLLLSIFYNSWCREKTEPGRANERIKKVTLFALSVLLCNQSKLYTGNVLLLDIHRL